jgi:hypothetical protein
MLSLRHRFLFIHIPKTAGNALQNVLRQYSEDRIVCLNPYQDGVERFEVRNDRFAIHKHSTLSDYQRELGDATLAGLFKFCCVRNPWERAISYFFSPHRGVTRWDRAGFIRALDEVVPVPVFLRMQGAAGKSSVFDNVDFIMRFERLDADFRQVCQRLNLPAQELAVRNRSTHAPFATYYDAELVEIVRCRFAEEIAYLGYGFDSGSQADPGAGHEAVPVLND